MKKTLFLLIILCSSSQLFSQEIKMKPTLLGYKFTENDRILSWNEVLTKAKINDDVYNYIKKGKSQSTISNILAFVGGGSIGFGLARGGETGKTVSYIGGGLSIAGIFFTIKGSGNLKKGIKSYNNSYKTVKNNFKPVYNILLDNYGIGVALKF